MNIGLVKATVSIVNEFTSALFYIYSLIWLELNLTFKWTVLVYAWKKKKNSPRNLCYVHLLRQQGYLLHF
jgi:hypothetical protein